MARFGGQPQKIVIGVDFRWFARFSDPPNFQFSKKVFFTPPYRAFNQAIAVMEIKIFHISPGIGSLYK